MSFRDCLAIVAVCCIPIRAFSQEQLTLPQAIEQVETRIATQRAELLDAFRQALKGEQESPDLEKKAATIQQPLQESEIAHSHLLTLESRIGKGKMPARSLAMWLELFDKSNPVLPVPTLAAEPAPDYAALDKHALDAPAEAKTSPRQLAQYLIGPAKTDAEKARVIFTWVTANISYDIDLIKNPVVKPELVLQTGRTVCDGFGYMTETLGKTAGLEIISVLGWGRSLQQVTSVPGSSRGPSGILYQPHRWNAVRLNGKPYFLETTFATHRILKGGNPLAHSHQPYNYFLVPPEILIYSHYPIDPRHQFLPKALTKADVENLPDLQPRFFYDGLKLLSHKQHTFHVKNEVVMTLEVPKEKLLTAHLLSEDSPGLQERAQITRHDKTLELRVRAPEAGKYILRLYSGSAESKEPLNAADFRVHVKEGGGKATPKRYLGFNNFGASLYQPLNKEVVAGQPTLFAITVPGAEQVRIKAGEQNFILRKHGNVFVGEEALPAGQALLMANTPDNPGRFSFLVEFDVKQ